MAAVAVFLPSCAISCSECLVRILQYSNCTRSISNVHQLTITLCAVAVVALNVHHIVWLWLFTSYYSCLLFSCLQSCLSSCFW